MDIILKVEHLSRRFGDNNVLWDVNFEIIDGQFAALVGPSGCGKSTALRALIGTDRDLKDPEVGGKVTLCDMGVEREITGPSRDIGIVYQKYALFPDKTAQQNVAVGLMWDETRLWQRFPIISRTRTNIARRNEKISWKDLNSRHLDEAAFFLEKFGLKEAMYRYPDEMSGGMCQRVAIAQALIMKPKVLLLDEPFGALDEATREGMQTMLLELNKENIEAKKRGENPPYTVLIVTHELKEGILVCDRVLGLSQYWPFEKVEDPYAQDAATIVYDKTAPVYMPDDPRDMQDFAAQSKEIYEFVMNPNVRQKREQLRTYWDQLRKDKEEAKDKPQKKKGGEHGKEES